MGILRNQDDLPVSCSICTHCIYRQYGYKKEYAFTGVFFGAAVQDSSEDYLTQFGQASSICANSEQTENALSFLRYCFECI